MTALKCLARGALVVVAVTASASADALRWDPVDWSGSGLSGTVGPAAATFSPTLSQPVAPTPPQWTSSPATWQSSSWTTGNVVSNTGITPPPAPAAPVYMPPTSSPTKTYDAFVNLGNGPYADSALLTKGGGQPWYAAPQVQALFGGAPDAAQRGQFTQLVLDRVQQTFNLSGIPVSLTADPNAQAAHTLSVVSNTNSSLGPLLGLTQLSGNGFDFVDQAAKVSGNVDQLAWIVAHNVSHELMLAFGVDEKYDTSGHSIDAMNAKLPMMLDPNATFSPGATHALLGVGSFKNGGIPSATAQGSLSVTPILGAQVIAGAQPVPEPTTILGWLVAIGAAFRAARSRRLPV